MELGLQIWEESKAGLDLEIILKIEEIYKWRNKLFNLFSFLSFALFLLYSALIFSPFTCFSTFCLGNTSSHFLFFPLNLTLPLLCLDGLVAGRWDGSGEGWRKPLRQRSHLLFDLFDGVSLPYGLSTVPIPPGRTSIFPFCHREWSVDCGRSSSLAKPGIGRHSLCSVLGWVLSSGVGIG